MSEPNIRQHWAKKAKRVHEQRCLTRLALQGQIALHDRADHFTKVPPFTKVKETWARWSIGGKDPNREPQVSALTVTLTRIAPRELDDDNLRGATKSCRDGIADALHIDDRDKRVTWCYAQRRGRVKEYGVEITIEART